MEVAGKPATFFGCALRLTFITKPHIDIIGGCRGIIPSLTLFRLKIAAIADSYCVCGFYGFFVKCVMIISLLNV